MRHRVAWQQPRAHHGPQHVHVLLKHVQRCVVSLPICSGVQQVVMQRHAHHSLAAVRGLAHPQQRRGCLRQLQWQSRCRAFFLLLLVFGVWNLDWATAGFCCWSVLEPRQQRYKRPRVVPTTAGAATCTATVAAKASASSLLEMATTASHGWCGQRCCLKQQRRCGHWSQRGCRCRWLPPWWRRRRHLERHWHCCRRSTLNFRRCVGCFCALRCHRWCCHRECRCWWWCWRRRRWWRWRFCCPSHPIRQSDNDHRPTAEKALHKLAWRQFVDCHHGYVRGPASTYQRSTSPEVLLQHACVGRCNAMPSPRFRISLVI